MQKISRRTVLAAFSAPIASATVASGLSHASLGARKSPEVDYSTDWRGIPQPGWNKDGSRSR